MTTDSKKFQDIKRVIESVSRRRTENTMKKDREHNEEGQRTQ